MRTILYVTGTRADFGLMLPTLRAIHADPSLRLKLCVTGMHLSPRYGMTVSEVEASELDIAGRIAVDVDTDSGLGMGLAAGAILTGIAEMLARQRPDLVLVLGDRTEMLAASIAAICAGIPLAHVHGGERSGTIDESIRHAISKLAHVHLVTTSGSRERLVAMGEPPQTVFVVGAPGLVGLRALASRSREQLLAEQRLDPALPTALVLFHPVVQEAAQAGEQMQALLDAVHDQGYQAVCLLPNADTGNSMIRQAIQGFCDEHAGFRALAHLTRRDFVSLMAVCDVMIGNSSSGILEAASFGTPVVNVGDRQNMRERNNNVVDTQPGADAIRAAIQAARALRGRVTTNLYEQAGTDQLIVSILKALRIDTALLKKINTY
jgi:GDP/UDP-N,N'-diacetylbacillosamine 2-epimerase (hydrolysing)